MNVILIVSDTFRRDNLSCYAADRPYASHLDRFAEDAVVFGRAYCGSFPTVPNRNDLLTGRNTFTYKDWAPLQEDDAVLAEILSEAGVLTSAVFDTPHPFRPGFNYQRGFDVWEQIRGQESDRWRSHPQVVEFPCDTAKLRDPHTTLTQYLRNVSGRRREDEYFCARTVRSALRWLEANRTQRPFFLYVDTFDPHEPWDPPQHYIDRYAPGYEGQRVIYPRYDRCDYLTIEELEYCRALYRAKSTLVDRWLGILLDGIRALGLWDETAVIFTSDHGFYLGEHGYIGKSIVREGYQQCLPLYPEVSTIPLMAHIPGCDARWSDSLVQPVDLPVTICELLDVRPHSQFDGHSVLPLIRGESAGVREVAISSPRISGPDLDVPHPSSRSSITDGEWLLVYGSHVESTDPAGRGVSIYGDDLSKNPVKTSMVDDRVRELKTLEGRLAPELYSLREDPACAVNLLASHRDEAVRLHRAFVEFLERSGVRSDHLECFKRI